MNDIHPSLLLVIAVLALAWAPKIESPNMPIAVTAWVINVAAIVLTIIALVQRGP